MNIVVVGQGAIGLLWYCNLSKCLNNNVSLSCSKNTKNIPSQTTLTDLDTTLHSYKVKLSTRDSLAQADAIIFCLKAFHLAEEIENTCQYLRKKTPLLLCHNGIIDHTHLSSYVVKNHPILTMLITHGSKREKPFSIIHTGLGKTDIGLSIGAITHSQQQNIIKTFSAALETVNWQENIKKKQWLKLAVNCVINPITALNNIDNGEVISRDFASVITAIIDEVVAIAETEKVFLNSNYLLSSVSEISRLTAKNCSSMRSDIIANRKTEIDSINGIIHQLGEERGIATPVNTRMWQQVKALEINS